MPSATDELRAAFLAQEIDIYGREVILDLRESKAIVPKKPIAVKSEEPKAEVVIPEAGSLSEFGEKIKGCLNCALGHTRKSFVFGSGNPNAALMFIGEAPGQDEDEQGLPFVGAAGQLLTKIINIAGFAREEVYIVNILKCRPPGNRVPLPEEVESCMPYLVRQMELLKPRYVICLGRTAAQSLIGVTDSLGNLRKKTYQFQQAQMFVTYHPAALLRNPQWRWDCYDDLKKFRAAYDAEVGGKPPMQELEQKKKA